MTYGVYKYLRSHKLTCLRDINDEKYLIHLKVESSVVVSLFPLGDILVLESKLLLKRVVRLKELVQI